MKYIQFIIFAFAIQILVAQVPQKVERITIAPQANEFYLEQAKLWKKFLEKEPKNADAWLNFYRANRYMQILSDGDTIFGVNRFKRLEAIEKEMEKNIPNSFEYNLVKWSNGGNTPELFPYLEKAYKIAPDRIDTYDSFVAYYELRGNTEKRDFFLKKWYETGKISAGLLNYNYNVLMSLKPNAILITNGDNDTYPIWVLQAIKGIRKDVKMLNFSMMYDDGYRQKMSKELGINLPDTLHSEAEEQEYVKNFIPNLAKNKGNSPVYTSNTCQPRIFESVEKDMYLVGLAYLYSTEKIDNVAIMKKNMEKQFSLDYLQVQFGAEIAPLAVQAMNTNYIVPMLNLYDHYTMAEEKDLAQKWKNLAILVAKYTEMQEHVNNYFKKK